MALAYFFGNPYHGHTMPTLPVVAELVRRGEKIVYYNTEKFASGISATGAEFRPYPDLGKLPGLEAIVDLAQWTLRSTQVILASEYPRILTEKPDYVITDLASFWGACASRSLGIPYLISNPMFAMNLRVWGLARKVMPRRKWRRKPLPGLVRGCFRVARGLNQLRGTYELRIPEALPIHSHDDQIVYTSKLLQPFGDHLGANFRFVGATGIERREEQSFDLKQLGEAPLVFVSMGTFLAANPTLVRSCFEVLSGLNTQVLMTLDPDERRDLIQGAPSNITFVKYAPQLAVLKRSKLFITHGGVGSVSEALCFGVPMIVLPEAFDHYLMAHRISEEGGGVMFAETPSPEQLANAVQKVLANDSFARNAARLGKSLTEAGGARGAADEILAWASSRLGKPVP